MKSFSHHVIKKKFKTGQDIVHSQGFVVVVAFFVSRNYIIKQLLTIEALDMIGLGQYWYSQVDITSCPMPQ